MSTIVLGAGGPRPQARVVGIVEDGDIAASSYAVVDASDILAVCKHEHHARSLLPAIKKGE